MKKSVIIIVVGLLFLFGGIFLYTTRKDDIVLNNGPVILSRDEAVSVIRELINRTIKVYESPTSIFNATEDVIEEDKTVFKINNYQEVISTIFSENGIKQLENTTFDDENFVIKNDDSVYFLHDIPIGNQYINSKIGVDQVTSIKENEIICDITFSSYDLDDTGVISYYVVTKTISVVKKDDIWVIEDFEYSNKW